MTDREQVSRSKAASAAFTALTAIRQRDMAIRQRDNGRNVTAEDFLDADVPMTGEDG
jgi:hypothetical protein